MITRRGALLGGVAGLVGAGMAPADPLLWGPSGPIFDTSSLVPPNVPYTNADGPGDGVTIAAASFFIGSRVPAGVWLSMTADTPSDGYSTIVSLVADDGTGGEYGKAGLPLFSGTVFTQSVTIGILSDSSLINSADPTFGVYSVLTNVVGVLPNQVGRILQQTKNGILWLGLTFNPSGTAWWYSGNGPGIGCAGQKMFNDQNGVTSAAAGTYTARIY